MARGLRIGSKAEVLRNLRSLLRVARARGSQDSVRDCKFSQQILAQYRVCQDENDRTKMRAYRAEASDYLMLLQGIEEQRHLWALDAGLEKKLSGQEIVNRSARRVGLEVPEMYSEKEDEEERKKAAAAKYLADKRAKEAAGQ
ncbi:hypothetical protein PF005_g13389 [Phytophthora fragariae]|uniref:Uncharacterized protein n=1 Tax=Phytophthora fragariae TaxID=53985 RepID=A0A6A3EU16_9STRA|nr:hypothetical protein PF003_g14014 [Phytophthora fragariae]KAE8935521.1 hypothetical protein PF009_g14536 [Phytophthora fragariae]KAE9004844.1 hypothetical protein PF011_g12288 [Phytophthora fragariae]KAE9105171.1 hypothetical protein PF010_g13118 [Phytophthora fragariae]KAE9106130.1 hypothetical protein PF007_g13523 [Phytophthora fragariae]